jgi:hypothetical protein
MDLYRRSELDALGLIAIHLKASSMGTAQAGLDGLRMNSKNSTGTPSGSST